MKNKTKGAAVKDGSATATDPGAAGRQIESLGASKGKKGDISDATKAKEKKVVAEATPDYEGSPRMGYTQNFGAARQGGYAKGAARVNAIMKGAAQDSTSSDVKFKINKKGGTLTKGQETVVNTPSISSSENIVDKGEDVFYKNLISSKKDMNTMTSQGIDPNDRAAVLAYGNTKGKSMSSGGSSSTVTTTSSQNNPVTTGSIAQSGNAEMANVIGDMNLKNYNTEMRALADSTSAHVANFSKLLQANTNRSSENIAIMQEHSGAEGSKAANIVREQGDIPTVSRTAGTHDQFRGSINIGGSDVPEMPTKTGGKSYFLPNKPATYKREGSLYMDNFSAGSLGGSRKKRGGARLFKK